MEVEDLPSYFTCPISLQIMSDPVTLCTGITYDRHTIERWLFDAKKNTCPVTKLELASIDLTPNHTLRRMIQRWCAARSWHGVEQIPMLGTPVDCAGIARRLIEEASGTRDNVRLQMDSLGKLRAFVGESERNRRCAEEAGLADFLVSVLRNSAGDHNNTLCCDWAQSGAEEPNTINTTVCCDEAVSILHHLQISEQGLRDLAVKNDDLIDILTSIMGRVAPGQSRAYALFLLKSLFGAIGPTRLVTINDNLFVEVVSILRDHVSYQATKAALRVLKELSSWGRNRIRFSDAGAVRVLIEIPLDARENRLFEMVLVVLDQLCRCAEGRQELLGHAAGLAVVSKGVVGITQAATQKAVSILHRLSRFSPTTGFVQEMLEVGGVCMLCLILQVGVDDGRRKSREKAEEILKVHATAWKTSACVPQQLRASYPSSASNPSRRLR